MLEKRLHIDSRSRVSLAAFIPKGSKISSLRAHVEGNKIILEPMVEVVIAESELWLYQNPQAVAALNQGIEDASQGKLHDLGSFAEFATDEQSS